MPTSGTELPELYMAPREEKDWSAHALPQGHSALIGYSMYTTRQWRSQRSQQYVHDNRKHKLLGAFITDYKTRCSTKGVKQSYQFPNKVMNITLVLS